MTFDQAYTDEAMTQQITSSLKGNFDEEHGILAHSGTVKVYTEWLTGEWFHIYNAKQFYTNAKSDGHYVLHADLDFSNQIWKPALSFNAFTGSIIGNGHTVKNVNAVQNTSARDRQEYGGLFGQIAAEAVIKDVTFENVSYTLMEGSLAPQSYFGLLAGAIDDGATLENVTVSGILKIDSKRYPANYNLGLLCGTGTHGNISTENITAVEINGDTETPLTVDPNTGLLILPDAQTQAS